MDIALGAIIFIFGLVNSIGKIPEKADRTSLLSYDRVIQPLMTCHDSRSILPS
jgi:hypothetical protein